jgi:hypothetical protein
MIRIGLLSMIALVLLFAAPQSEATRRVRPYELRIEGGTAVMIPLERRLRDNYSLGLNGRVSVYYTYGDRMLFGVQYRILKKDYDVPGGGGDLKSHLLGLKLGAIAYRERKNEIALAAVFGWVHARQTRRMLTACGTSPLPEQRENGLGLGAQITYSHFISPAVGIGIDLEYSHTFLDADILSSGNIGGFWLGPFLQLRL